MIWTRTPKPAAALDTSVAHPARVYDYWLGGKDNFAADREAAEQVIAVNPILVLPGVRANRAFLGRAVRLPGWRGRDPAVPRPRHRAADRGEHPPGGAGRSRPTTRVVYVDNDRSNSGCMHQR